jgi:serine/threonine protein kinase
VRCGKVWKLESLVLSEDYSRANGLNCEYLWSSKHEAPEFVGGRQYSDEEHNAMTVWNLGCILVHLLSSGHRLTNRSVMEKFLNKPFTFEAIGIKNEKINKLSQQTKDLLAGMLHYDAKKRIKLQALFENKSASEAVAKHAL